MVEATLTIPSSDSKGMGTLELSLVTLASHKELAQVSLLKEYSQGCPRSADAHLILPGGKNHLGDLQQCPDAEGDPPDLEELPVNPQ